MRCVGTAERAAMWESHTDASVAPASTAATARTTSTSVALSRAATALDVSTSSPDTTATVRSDSRYVCAALPLLDFDSNFARSTRSSAIAEGPRDASCRLKSCQLPRNSAESTCTTSPEPSISCR